MNLRSRAGRVFRSLFQTFLVLLFAGMNNAVQAQFFWVEDFGDNGGICDSYSFANNYVTANGMWEVALIGVNDTAANDFFISAGEPGKPEGDCSSEGCWSTAIFESNRTLHVGNVTNSPNALIICPAGDCGALYDPGGFQNAVETKKRAQSPVIDCSSQNNVVLTFLYIENGDGATDNALVEYYDGTTWSVIGDMPKSTSCGGYSTWTRYTVALPTSADFNPNVRIGFTWVNDNGGVGLNPSFAVDSIALAGVPAPVADFEASDTLICVGDCIDFYDQSLNFPDAFTWNFFGGTPATSSSQNPTSVCFNAPGTYTIQLIVGNAAGSDTLTLANYIRVEPCVGPTADFSVSDSSVCERSCVDFTDQSVNGALSWLWLFPGGTPSTSTDPSPTGICYNTPGLYDVTLIVSNAFGADTLTKSGYMNIETCPLPVANFATFTPAICSNQCVDFFDQSQFTDTSTQWFWYFPGATPDTSTLRNPTNICYPQDGLYDVQLIVTNSYGSDTTLKYSFIQVESVPTAFVGPDTSMYYGSSYQLTAGGGVTYQWSPAAGLDSVNSATPIATPNETTIYTVQIGDGTGCTAVRQVLVEILFNNNYFVPNAFSPNGDGANDYLFVRGNNFFSMQFTVFDRWGEQVFETKTQEIGWDGTYKGKDAVSGVYTWVFKLFYADGKTVNQTGTVLLIR